MAREKRDELKPFLEQARAIMDQLAALRDEFKPVKESLQAARESGDDAAMSAALDALLPLQEKRHQLLSDLSQTLEQILAALSR